MEGKKDAQKAREEYLNKTFRLMWQLLFIFGVPAALAVIGGRWIEKSYEKFEHATFVLLLIAFVFSWVLVIRQYRKLEQERKALESNEK